MSRGLLLLLLGGAALRISAFSTTYLNYVKPGFRPLLIAAGVVVCGLGVVGIVRERREPDPVQADRQRRAAEAEEAHLAALLGRETVGPASASDDHHHDHSPGPRIAWLLCLPPLAIFLIAPPALGSFVAERREDSPAPPPPEIMDAFVPLADKDPIAMPIGEFIGRAWDDPQHSLTGRRVRLTGFVTPSTKKGRWYLTRMAIMCCAADAIALKVAIDDTPAPKRDSWVEVTGTWIPTSNGTTARGVPPRMTTTKVGQVSPPDAPYE
jgi:uncharacterized repeat protein (TIGR03943 family)